MHMVIYIYNYAVFILLNIYISLIIIFVLLVFFAYTGHGMVAVAKCLNNEVDGFAVANMNEGIILRENGIDVETIVILQGANDETAFESSLKYNLIPIIHNEMQLNYILSDKYPTNTTTYSTTTIPITVWIHVDTGMHRLGMSPEYCDIQIPLLINKFGVRNVVLSSHFACSDEVGLDFNKMQVKQLTELKDKYNLDWSLANSGGILSIPESHGTWNRAGYMLYGNSPLDTVNPGDAILKPAMTLTAPVIALRTVPIGEPVGYSRTWTPDRVSVIATIAIGYGDGYPRTAPNGTPIILNSQLCPMAGRVSMDMITVDVTDVNPPVCVGDTAYLWGTSKGNINSSHSHNPNENTNDNENDSKVSEHVQVKDQVKGQVQVDVLAVNSVADHVGTIGYELLTRLLPRTKRVYEEEV